MPPLRPAEWFAVCSGDSGLTKSGTGLSRIDGPALKAMLAAAADWISQNAGAIDAINVFPVPDGDTGSNMSATLRSAADAAAGADGGAASVLAAAAKGALLGARGNSGVILSQILDGLAAGAGQAETLDGRALARCLLQADTAARLSVTEPKEGTILTVLTDAAAAAEEATANSSSVVEVLEAGTLAARASVARTPELLPILRQAGVVDSGGLGLSIILDGCLAKISNTSSAVLRVPVELENRANQQSLSVVCDVPAGNSSLGYCTEFIIEGESLRRDPLRDELRRLGDSVLVVGQERLLRVHLHTADPGAALSLGLRHGALSRIKVDNLEDQRRALGGEAAPSVAVGASVVAVAAGEGFGSLLAGYGAIVVDGGQTQNPSTAEILAAIDHAPGKAVFVLPNNPNILATATQAARLARNETLVIPTTSIPQGIAAVLAFNPARSIEENTSAMEQAASAVRTAEITRAARDISIGGVDAVRGQPIAIVDDELALAADSPEAAAVAAAGLIAEGGEIATLYYGLGVTSERAEGCAALIRTQYPNLEVESVGGGHPHYDYILSIE